MWETTFSEGLDASIFFFKQHSKSKDQPGKVANPARGQLNRENVWSRYTVSAVPSRVSLFISILRLNLMLACGIPPDFFI